MPLSPHEKIGSIVQRGILLFSQVVPIPSASLIAAIAAAIFSKSLELKEKHVSEVLSYELQLQHVAYIEPDDEELLRFFEKNPLFPGLSSEFETEIESGDIGRLRAWYPYLYAVLILKRQIPTILFHDALQKGNYRKLAEEYERLSAGFKAIEGDVELHRKMNQFALELLEVLNEVYEAVKAETENERNQLAFEIIDYIREVATA
jgi:hypothetical protein